MDALVDFGLHALFPSCTFVLFFMLTERRQAKAELLFPLIVAGIAALLFQLLFELILFARSEFLVFITLILLLIIALSAVPGTFIYLIFYLGRLYDHREDYFSNSPHALRNGISMVVFLIGVLLFIFAFVPFIYLLANYFA